MDDEKSQYFFCDRIALSFLISAVKVRRYLRSRELVFLAELKVLNKDVLKLKSILVLKFLDIFLEKLPSLPPTRNVEFGIDVQPTISIIHKYFY